MTLLLTRFLPLKEGHELHYAIIAHEFFSSPVIPLLHPGPVFESKV